MTPFAYSLVLDVVRETGSFADGDYKITLPSEGKPLRVHRIEPVDGVALGNNLCQLDLRLSETASMLEY